MVRGTVVVALLMLSLASVSFALFIRMEDLRVELHQELVQGAREWLR